MPALTELDALAECEAIWQATEERERQTQARRLEAPLLRIWDGDWHMAGILAAEYSASFEWVDNDTGPGVTEIPFDHYVARWIHDERGRMARGEKRNVHITVDKDGARWSGRLEDCSVEKREDGSQVLVVRWLSDYETVKFYNVWSNPFLPAILQFPRVFLLAGGARWVLLTTLFLQIFREQTSIWSIPDDPLSGGWFSLDMSNWSVVVKPHSFVDDLEDGILWALLISRWKNFHDIATPILEDAELSLTWRRYLETDDEQPIAGQTLRHGALVIDIVDKSGYYIGTANGGTLWDGLVRTIAEFASDFIDSTIDLIEDVDVPQYRIPGLFLTDKRKPYVTYLEGEQTGIQSSKFTRAPSKAVQVNCGGHSMPGVNELISAAIQMAGDLIAAALFVPPIGGAVDAILKPLYTDTILSWMSVKSVQRAQNSGWSRYFEYFQDGADRAYTLQSLLVLRAGFWATRNWFTCQLKVNDGSPWLIGDNGQGHFFIGDRIGAAIAGDTTGQLYVDRVKSLTLAWSADAPVEWIPIIGDNKALKDPAIRAMEKLEGALAGLHDLGVF